MLPRRECREVLSWLFYCNPAALGVFEGSDGVVLHVAEDAGVGVEGDSCGGVAKEFLERSCAPLVRSSVARVWRRASERMGRRANINQQRLEAPLVYVGCVKEPANHCSEYEIPIAVEGTCAGDQIRRSGIQLASPCAPWVSLSHR